MIPLECWRRWSRLNRHGIRAGRLCAGTIGELRVSANALANERPGFGPHAGSWCGVVSGVGASAHVRAVHVDLQGPTVLRYGAVVPLRWRCCAESFG